jgi:hypothetical protein
VLPKNLALFFAALPVFAAFYFNIKRYFKANYLKYNNK